MWGENAIFALANGSEVLLKLPKNPKAPKEKNYEEDLIYSSNGHDGSRTLAGKGAAYTATSTTDYCHGKRGCLQTEGQGEHTLCQRGKSMCPAGGVPDQPRLQTGAKRRQDGKREHGEEHRGRIRL